MAVEVHGRQNYQRFAETWAAMIAARDGKKIAPGSVRVELKESESEASESVQGI